MQDKKASMVLYTLGMLVISAIVFVALYAKAKEQGSGDFLFKAAIARDISLLIDSLYAVPGDAEIIYPVELSKYGIEIKDSTVSVFYKGIGFIESDVESYSFVGTEDSLYAKFEGPAKLKFVKEGNKISIEAYEIQKS